jgi:lysophospholipase L1-like esterase
MKKASDMNRTGQDWIGAIPGRGKLLAEGRKKGYTKHEHHSSVKDWFLGNARASRIAGGALRKEPFTSAYLEFTMLTTLVLPLLLTLAQPARKASDPEVKWNKAITKIEEKLKDQPFKEGSVMFAGASGATRWKLENYFPGKGYANVAFGGSRISDNIHFAPRIEQKYKPGKIVFFGGGNDLASGLTPELMLKDYQAYVAAVHMSASKCKILFISIRPTIRRESKWATQQKANKLIQEYCSKDPRLTFLDVTKDLLDKDGKPKREMLVDDLQHPSHECYRLLAVTLRDFLEK